jgi:predicted dinucleotide-binding enzyme
VIGLAGAPALAGKVVIDTTNPIAAVPPVNGVLKFFTSHDESLMEQMQRAHPNVRFVKAFNSVGNARMVNPTFAAGRPTMFVCGNDAAAKQTVTDVLDAFGWETLDLGGVEGRARSSRSASCGASPDFSATSGRTRSRCCTPSGPGRRDGGHGPERPRARRSPL